MAYIGTITYYCTRTAAVRGTIAGSGIETFLRDLLVKIWTIIRIQCSYSTKRCKEPQKSGNELWAVARSVFAHMRQASRASVLHRFVLQTV